MNYILNKIWLRYINAGLFRSTVALASLTWLAIRWLEATVTILLCTQRTRQTSFDWLKSMISLYHFTKELFYNLGNQRTTLFTIWFTLIRNKLEWIAILRANNPVFVAKPNRFFSSKYLTAISSEISSEIGPSVKTPNWISLSFTIWIRGCNLAGLPSRFRLSLLLTYY